MSVSSVNPSVQSGAEYNGIKNRNNAQENPAPKSSEKDSSSGSATSYSIGYDRVSKDVYDRYDTDGDGRINKKELDEYKAEKSGVKSVNANSGNYAPLTNLGNNVDIIA
ncbi:EF-hand domain-containing protein [Seleniivibrio sp.]|uniref:EF-hand domain-containing protein n=1 Tax=Seleniivibrio sp. TaxID=2898801 RepID=UPI0025CBB6BB|nr:EF-hand domain-containing protein [Seleniivibrio sp.]MCD8552373.1 hypothetical protein [Seleniivibrio sp.]